VLNYALTNNAKNCAHVVDQLGLGTLFAAFMKKGSKKSKKNAEEAVEDEHIVCCLASLFKHLNGSRLDRLVAKFSENDGEKVERLMELHERYTEKLSKAEDELREELAAEEEIDEEELYLKRLDAGLFTLQMVDLLIAYIFEREDTRTRAKEIISLKGYSIDVFKKVLFEYAQNAGDDSKEENDPINEQKFDKKIAEKFRPLK